MHNRTPLLYYTKFCITALILVLMKLFVIYPINNKENSISIFYGVITVNSPGLVICITPAHMHIHLLVLFKVGMLASSTVGAPGTHGAGVLGMHGMGVNTPKAAAVAAATVGFAGELHIPNGKIFTIGLLSIIFASGVPVKTMLAGSTISELGAAPKLHCSIAPIQTCCAI
jgi:hypothetical protein